MSRAPPPPHKHRRQHTHLNDGIWMANVCNPATVCGNVELPFNGDTQTTCWPLATNTMFELPVIWTPTFGGTTTKHITQRNTSPNLSRTNSEPCRVHLSMLSCADPAHATWVCNTTTNNVNDTPPTFQNDPLHHGHTSSDVRSTNAVREAWSTSVSRPSPRQPNCKRQKHTKNAVCVHAWRGGGSAIQKMVPLDHNVQNTCSDNTCICLTSLEHCRVQRNTHTPRHITRVELCIQFYWWRSSTNVFLWTTYVQNPLLRSPH